MRKRRINFDLAPGPFGESLSVPTEDVGPEMNRGQSRRLELGWSDVGNRGQKIPCSWKEPTTGAPDAHLTEPDVGAKFRSASPLDNLKTER